MRCIIYLGIGFLLDLLGSLTSAPQGMGFSATVRVFPHFSCARVLDSAVAFSFHLVMHKVCQYEILCLQLAPLYMFK